MLKILVIYLFSLFSHPVHVSMSSMDMMEDGSAYLITLRMYSDDLLLDLISIFDISEEQIENKIYKGPEEKLEDYVNDRMKFIFDGKRVRAELTGREDFEIETLILLQIPVVERAKIIEIHNQVLTDLYADQINLFIYKNEKMEMAFRFTKDYYKEKLIIH